MGCSVGTVKSQVSAALGKLRERVGVDSGVLLPGRTGGDPMNTTLRELAGAQQCGAGPPHLDVDELVVSARPGCAVVVSRSGRCHCGRGGWWAASRWPPRALAATPLRHRLARQDHRPGRKDGPDTEQTGSMNRLLTYSVGTTIHWGERTIDVRQQTNRWPGAGSWSTTWTPLTSAPSSSSAKRRAGSSGRLGVPRGAAAVWFTDGSAPVRIGTTSGAGSAVSASPPRPRAQPWPGSTRERKPHRVRSWSTTPDKWRSSPGSGERTPSPLRSTTTSSTGRLTEPPATGSLWGAAYGCKATARVMRFDTASGQQAPGHHGRLRSRPASPAWAADWTIR